MTIEWATALVRFTFLPVEESPVLRWAMVATALDTALDTGDAEDAEDADADEEETA